MTTSPTSADVCTPPARRLPLLARCAYRLVSATDDHDSYEALILHSNSPHLSKKVKAAVDAGCCALLGEHLDHFYTLIERGGLLFWGQPAAVAEARRILAEGTA